MWAGKEASALVQGRTRKGSNQVRAIVREEWNAGAVSELLVLPVVQVAKDAACRHIETALEAGERPGQIPCYLDCVFRSL